MDQIWFYIAPVVIRQSYCSWTHSCVPNGNSTKPYQRWHTRLSHKRFKLYCPRRHRLSSNWEHRLKALITRVGLAIKLYTRKKLAASTSILYTISLFTNTPETKTTSLSVNKSQRNRQQNLVTLTDLLLNGSWHQKFYLFLLIVRCLSLTTRQWK